MCHAFFTVCETESADDLLMDMEKLDFDIPAALAKWFQDHADTTIKYNFNGATEYYRIKGELHVLRSQVGFALGQDPGQQIQSVTALSLGSEFPSIQSSMIEFGM
jgi:hypothetical protein